MYDPSVFHTQKLTINKFQVYGLLFSDDRDVVVLVSKVMPLVASFQVADGLAGSCGGVLRGQGKYLDLLFKKHQNLSAIH